LQEQLIQHLRWPTRAIVTCWVWYENDFYFYLKLCRIDWWLFWVFFFNEDYPICEKLSSENYLPYENWQEWWRIVFNKDSSFHYGHIIFIFQYKSYCKPLKQIIQILLWNQSANLKQTWHGWSLGSILSKLCPVTTTSIQDGCQEQT
jgi:hypothetical protein